MEDKLKEAVLNNYNEFNKFDNNFKEYDLVNDNIVKKTLSKEDKELAKKLLEENKYNKSTSESFKYNHEKKSSENKSKRKIKVINFDKSKANILNKFKDINLSDSLNFTTNETFKKIKSKITMKTTLIAASVLVVAIFGVTLVNITKNILNSSKNETSVEAFNNNVNIYKNILNKEENKEENNNKTEEQIKDELNALVDTDDDTDVYSKEDVDGNITFTYVGEIMMGAEVTENLGYMYNTAFKQIYNNTRYSDYTYTVLTTAITSLSEIKNAKSRYLVTEDILNALNALGIDCVSLASDHMTAFSKLIFNNTVSSLRNNDFSVSGMEDDIVYTEIEDKRVAIVSATNSYLDSKTVYKDYGINVYDEQRMKEDIKVAKDNADIVIVDVHWGLLVNTKVTYEMEKIARLVIDSGADIVLGSHSLGAKPVTMYKGKPIIYSAGYLITYSELEEAKRSYVYDIDFNSENKVSKITMTPMYTVGQKSVLLYNEYSKEECNKYNEVNMKKMQAEGINCYINNGKIVVNLIGEE